MTEADVELNPEIAEDYFDLDGDEISCTFVSDGEHLEGLVETAEKIITNDPDAIGSLTIRASLSKSIDVYINSNLIAGGSGSGATISETDRANVKRLIEGFDDAASKLRDALTKCQVISDADHEAWLRSMGHEP